MLYGPKRRRVPSSWDVDNPMQTGVVQNRDAYMQAVAAQRPYFFDHISALFDKNAEEFHALTGRRYSRIDNYRCDDADYIILGQGSMTVQAAAVADWMRETRKIKVGWSTSPCSGLSPANCWAGYSRARRGGGIGAHRPAAVGRLAADARSALHRDQVHGKRARAFLC